MLRLACSVKFRIFDPLPEYCKLCPYTLVTSNGGHPHPIPLPQKTPPVLHSEMFKLLESMIDDLPDMTSRCCLRHTVLKAYLTSHFPTIQSPALSDLHISLANCSHLKSYIAQAKQAHFPKGTGWEGQLHQMVVVGRETDLFQQHLGTIYVKQQQDLHAPLHDHYIRKIIEIPHNPTDVHEEDEPSMPGDSGLLRIVICMSEEGSERLLNTQYLSSDIAFKHIVDFHEFEMACTDRESNAIKSINL
jgi:hypothetical protein